MNTRVKLNKRILVAMSGGVDSSAAAYLLQKEGYEIIGATMKLFCYGDKSSSPKSCCSLEAIADAKAVCEKLGIPHYVFDMEKEFEEEVIQNFISEYEKGRTPNPCIRCNQLIKFDYLLKKAQELNCDYIATGHYARIASSCHSERLPAKDEPRNPLKLLRGIDNTKDQTYFLYRLNQKQLAKIKFPLGELTKMEVREIAKEAGLKTAEKAESQEICFVDGGTSDYLKGKVKVKKGDILGINGKKIGEHEGTPFYTIGQRKGLGGGFESPMYVTEINSVANTITVGEEKDLYKREVIFDEPSWTHGWKNLVIEKRKGLSALIRYNMEPNEVEEIRQLEDGRYKAIFKEKVRAVTPGQAVVFYLDHECLGGGIIA